MSSESQLQAHREPNLPRRGDRVRDKYHDCHGTVTGLRSGMSIAVTWDDGHPFTDSKTLAMFDDIELSCCSTPERVWIIRCERWCDWFATADSREEAICKAEDHQKDAHE